VGSFLRARNPELTVSCWDGAVLNFGWKELCKLLVKGFDAVGLLNDFDGVDTFPRTLDYIEELCPSAKTFTFGRLSKQIPGFFQHYKFDAVVESGDYEAGVEFYLKFLLNGDKDCPGVWISTKPDARATPGISLMADEWVFPDVREIPYEDYRRLYSDDLNKYCGIPNCLELVVPIARGCPIGCEYCDVPSMQGARERRVSVDSTLQYIRNATDLREFDYVSFYAPTFTLRREWVLQFCDEILARKLTFLWKCVTTLSHLDDILLQRMAAAGCVRVSVGLETLDPHASQALPVIKRNIETNFDRVADTCRRVGIELNCFVILGLPGDTLAGVEYTVRRVLERGARVRPTVYTPYRKMRPDMTLSEVSRYNRQLFVPESLSSEKASGYYRLLYANRSDKPTQLGETISTSARHRVPEAI
jgi:anaerobic magnesium-protoporphyrin IX monomethyl ester cyclase